MHPWNVSTLRSIGTGAVLAGLALGGCTTSRPVELWQERVTQYVADEGNGDITSLRNTEPGAARPVFGVTSGSVEVQGLLLGCSTMDQQRWWTYIVGVMKNDNITDLRIVAVSEVGGEVVFSQSTQDEAATERYRDGRLKQWTANRLDPATDGDFVCSFPGPNDSFTLNAAGTTATVTERQSGARWTVLLATDPLENPRSQAMSAASGH